MAPSNTIEYQQVVNSESNGKNIKIVFFDWDDTLCPTTAVFKSKFNNISFSELNSFGKYAYDLLLKYVQLFGVQNVHIVTNATKNWVFQSLSMLNIKHEELRANNDLYSINYFQLIYTVFIQQYQMNIISAQDLFLEHHSKLQVTKASTTEWKSFTFKCIAKSYFRCYQNNIKSFSIICIGDSMDEYDASSALKQWLQNTYQETEIHLNQIKLESKPSMAYMMHECRFLVSLIPTFQQQSPALIHAL